MNPFALLIAGILQTVLSILDVAHTAPTLPPIVQNNVAQTIQEIPPQIVKIDDLMSKDQKGIYFLSLNDSQGNALTQPLKNYITDADAMTFRHVGSTYSYSPNTEKDGYEFKFAYYTDKSHVFFLQYYSEMVGSETQVGTIQGADPATFVVDSATSSHDANQIYVATWDKNLFKYVVSASSSSRVSGMSKYTDPDFGFSFWYPSDWAPTQDPNLTTYAPYNQEGGQSIKRAIIFKGSESAAEEIRLWIIYSPSNIVTLGGTYLHDINHYAFSFDPKAESWTVHALEPVVKEYDNENVHSTESTIGGLKLLNSVYYITPIGQHYFVVAYNGTAGVDQGNLMQTLSSSDLSVGTPINAAEQTKMIQAEKDAYTEQ